MMLSVYLSVMIGMGIKGMGKSVFTGDIKELIDYEN